MKICGHKQTHIYGSVRLIRGCPAFGKKNPVASPQPAPGGPNPAASSFSGSFRDLSGPGGRNCSVFCSVGLFDGSMRKPLFFCSKERRRVCPAFWKKNAVDGREPPGLEAGLPRHPSEGSCGIAYRRCMDKFDTKLVVFFPSGLLAANKEILNGRCQFTC